MNTTHRLRSGETLEVTALGPGAGRGDTATNRDIWSFMTRPFDPWMTPSEAAYVARILRGDVGDSLFDHLYVGRLDGAIAGTAWHATSSRSHALGGYGNVLTDPDQRGKGIAQILTEHSVAQFWADGGQAIYLGTVNPIAQRVYAKYGYQPYNGLAMRAVRAGLDPAGFDADFFGAPASTRVRDAEFGDLAAFTALLLAPEPRDWVVRHYTEAIFYAPPVVEATGCLRPFYNSFERHELNPANQFKLLTTDDDRVVGAASVQAPAGGALHDQGRLEFVVYPTHHTELAGLLEHTLAAAADAGLRDARAYAVAPERGSALEAAGFTIEATRAGALDLGAARADVHVYRRSLS